MPSLAELLGYLVQPLGGPMIPALAKSQSNATAGSIPGVAPPKGQPLSSPAEMMAALNAISNSQYENKLRQAQAKELERLGTFREKLGGSFEDVMKLMGSGGATPATASETLAAPAPLSLSGGPALGGTAPGPTSFSPVPDKSNFASGLRKLTELGVDPEVAAGAVTYMDRNENGFNPLAVNPTSGAFGRGQWLGPRKENLISQYGNRPTDDQQAEFMGDELTGKFPDARGVLNRLLAAKTSKEGYDIWGTHYERPGAAALAKAGVGGALRGPGPSYASVGSQQTPQERELWIRGRADAATAELANASQHAPVNTITPLASGQGAPMSMAPGMPAAGAMSPMQQAIVRLGVMSRMAKMGDVADPLEKMFYNSPQQKGEVANAEELAKLRAQLGFAGPLAGAKTQAERTVTEPSDIRINAAKSAVERANDEQKQRLAASLDVVPVTVRLPDGSTEERMVPRSELAASVASPASGTAVAGSPAAPAQQMLPGGAVITGKPTGVGPIEPGYRLVTPPGGGGPRQEIIPGGSAAKAGETAQGESQQSANIMQQDIGRVLKLTSGGWATGWKGMLLKDLPETEASNVRALLKGIDSNIATTRITVMRQSSPSGAALGATSDRDIDLLKATMGSLEQTQSKEQFETTLKRLGNMFYDTIHGTPANLEEAVQKGTLSRLQFDQAIARRAKDRYSDDAAAPTTATSGAYNGTTWSLR